MEQVLKKQKEKKILKKVKIVDVLKPENLTNKKNKTKIRIYLKDWLLSAGIVGFLKIRGISGIEIGENYIEFERSVFENFTDKYFEYAFNRYGRLDRVINKLQKVQNETQEYIENKLPYKEDFLLKQFDICENETNFGLLKNVQHEMSGIYSFTEKSLKKLCDLDTVTLTFITNLKDVKFSFNEIEEKLSELVLDVSVKTIIMKNIDVSIDTLTKEDALSQPQSIVSYVKKILKIIEDNYQLFYDNDVTIFIKNFIGQQTICNKSYDKEKDKKGVFYKEFEQKIVTDTNKKTKLPCIACGEEKSKKGRHLNTSFLGINKENINYCYNFNTDKPICDICEILYMCAFAGLTEIKNNTVKKHYFINNNSSVQNLIDSNDNFQHSVIKGVNPCIEYYSQIIAHQELNKAKYILGNISIIELDVYYQIKGMFPKIHSINTSKKKFEFFETQTSNLLKLSLGNYSFDFKKNVVKVNLLDEVIEHILKDKINYRYLNRLIRKLFDKNYKTFITISQLQNINIIIFNYLQLLGEKKMNIEEKVLWAIHKEGKELSKKLKRENKAGKLDNLYYKLMSALRLDDNYAFQEAIIRSYKSFNEDIPDFMVRVYNKELLHPIGNSFVLGLLSKDWVKDDKNIIEKKEGSNNV